MVLENLSPEHIRSLMSELCQFINNEQQPQYFVTTNQSEKLGPFIPFQTKNVFFIEIITLDLLLT